jgi:S-adenosylmethionine:tRNA-ribosyltransferase-isomerase (queuine synthetase)
MKQVAFQSLRFILIDKIYVRIVNVLLNNLNIPHSPLLRLIQSFYNIKYKTG